MSRIGKQPIAIPTGVEVKLNDHDRSIDVKGPKGNLSFSWREEVSVSHDEEQKQIACAIADPNERPVKRMPFGERLEVELIIW